MTKRVTIMRGPSGSGKGTFVREKMWHADVVSADDFFMVPVEGEDGETVKYEYRFDPYKIALAHTDCFHRFLKCLENGVEDIVVDNTNIHLWEFQNYITAAEMMGYEVQVKAFLPTLIEDITICAKRNAHGTPIEVVARMCYEFEKYPNEEYMPISE